MLQVSTLLHFYVFYTLMYSTMAWIDTHAEREKTLVKAGVNKSLFTTWMHTYFHLTSVISHGFKEPYLSFEMGAMCDAQLEPIFTLEGLQPHNFTSIQSAHDGILYCGRIQRNAAAAPVCFIFHFFSCFQLGPTTKRSISLSTRRQTGHSKHVTITINYFIMHGHFSPPQRRFPPCKATIDEGRRLTRFRATLCWQVGSTDREVVCKFVPADFSLRSPNWLPCFQRVRGESCCGGWRTGQRTKERQDWESISTGVISELRCHWLVRKKVDILTITVGGKQNSSGLHYDCVEHCREYLPLTWRKVHPERLCKAGFSP